ncbi:MAG: hypothetical protein JXB62_13850 [Pirellulales bacterium]|nr:hypothetical protein [Pirellulales bacterium]
MPRTWTDRTGEHQFEAEFADFSDGKILLKQADGQIIAIDIEDCSRADQQYVREELRRRRAGQTAEVSDRPGTVLYGPGRELCKLLNPAIDESSGLACSRAVPGVFWTHNDSGDSARIYAFDAHGTDLGSCLLADVQAFDFEDVVSFRLGQKSYLLVGDTGNNGRASPVQILYLIEEPRLDPKRGVAVGQVPVARTIYYAYEDDHRDCEAVAIDPTSETILLVAKEKVSRCDVYALAWPKDEAEKVALARKIAVLRIPSATAMDISPDGLRTVVLTYGNAYEYTRGEQEDWSVAFGRRPCEIILPQRLQGESICYGPDGKTLYLTSEKRPAPLWEVPVRTPERTRRALRE